jgi:hypothetical protein
MNILILSPYTNNGLLDPIFKALSNANDVGMVAHNHDGIIGDAEWDFVVSYGYRRIIRDPYLTKWKRRSVNIHISYLPYNRGCHPNLWSWYEGTPNGVSIHRIDKEIDEGELLFRRKVYFHDRGHTLATTYTVLHQAAGKLFFDSWPALRRGDVDPYPRDDRGGYHDMKESLALLAQFPKGFDTPVLEVINAGMKKGVNRGEAERGVSLG